MEKTDIREQIKRKIPDLTIQRIPDKTKLMFKAFAKEEFCSDYGMTLRHLMDFYFGLIPKGTEHIENQVEFLTEELNELKKILIKTEEKPKYKIMANGTKLPIK